MGLGVCSKVRLLITERYRYVLYCILCTVYYVLCCTQFYVLYCGVCTVLYIIVLCAVLLLEIVLYSVLYFARRFVHHSRGPNRSQLFVPPVWRCVSTLVLHLSLSLVWRLDPCIRVQVGEYPELHHDLTSDIVRVKGPLFCKK